MYCDFIQNGDLMGILNNWTKFEADHAKFYVAQIVTCFEYLHKKNFVYRDLKPENVLM